MPEDATLTESSTVTAVPVYNLEEMTPEQRGTFMKDGTVPTKAASDPATPKTAEASAPASGVTSDPPTESQETKPKTEARIQELLTQRREAREALEAERRETARLKGILEGAKVPLSPNGAEKPNEGTDSPPKRPKLDDFETVAQWAEATAQFAEEMAEYKTRKALEAHRVEQTQSTAKNEVVEAFRGRVNAAKAELPDFEAVAFSEATPLNETMGRYILDSEKGPQVAYWLGQHQDEATRISALPPLRAAREMAFIEAKLNGTTAPPPPKPKVSAAPPPTSEVSGTAGTQPDEAIAALNRGDTGRYMEIMNERDRAKKRR